MLNNVFKGSVTHFAKDRGWSRKKNMDSLLLEMKRDMKVIVSSHVTCSNR